MNQLHDSAQFFGRYVSLLLGAVVIAAAWMPVRLLGVRGHYSEELQVLLYVILAGLLAVLWFILPGAFVRRGIQPLVFRFLDGLRNPLARRRASDVLAVAGIVCLSLRWQDGARTLSGPSSLILLLAVFLVGAFIRGLLLPSHLVRLRSEVVHLPALVLAVVACALATGTSLFSGTTISTSIAIVATVWAIGFSLMDRALAGRIRSTRSIERNLEDALWREGLFSQSHGADSAPPTNDIAKFYVSLRMGRIQRAGRLLEDISGQLDERTRIKARCRLLYHEGEFRDVLQLADDYLAKGGRESDVLTSLRCLSLLRTDRVEESQRILRARSERLPSNPYIDLDLALAYFVQGNLDDAIRTSEAANETYQREMGSDCPIALNNAAHFRCQRIFDEYPDLTHVGEISIAEEYCERAKRAILGVSYASLLDTRAMCRMLKGDYNGAAGLLGRSLILAPGNSARNHLGALFMIGSPNYLRASYFFSSTAYELRDNRTHPDYRIAVANLARIDVARREQIIFDDRIVRYHTQRTPLIPREAITSEGSKWMGFTPKVKGLYLGALDYLWQGAEVTWFAMGGDVPERKASVAVAPAQDSD